MFCFVSLERNGLKTVQCTPYLCGGQHRVLVQAQNSVRHNGLVRQEPAAHHLREETCLNSLTLSRNEERSRVWTSLWFVKRGH